MKPLPNQDQTTKASRPKTDWALLWFVYLTLVTLGLADNARGALYPDLLMHFQVTHTTGSLFFLVASLAAVVNNALTAIWLPRLGSLRALVLFTLLHSISLFSMASFGWFTDITGFLVATGVLGAAMGGMGVTQNLLVAQSVSGPRRRQAVAGLHAMYGMSSLLAPLTVTWYASSNLGETYAPVTVFALFGILSMGLFAAGRVRLRAEQPIADAHSLERFEWPRDQRLKRQLYAQTLSFAAVMSIYVVAELAVSTRLTVFAREELGLSRADANVWLSGFFVALFAGRSLFATLPLPFRHSTVLWTSSALSAVAIALGLSIWPFALVISGFTMAPFYPVLMTLLTERMGPASGFGTGWCLVAQGLALALMHWLLGVLSDEFGIATALLLALGALFAVMMLLYFLRQHIGLEESDAA